MQKKKKKSKILDLALFISDRQFCAQGLNLGGYDSGFSNFSKKWVKMVKLFDFYGILWYFEKFDLWGAYGWTWDIVDIFVKSIHCPL